MSKRAFSRSFDMPTVDPDKEDELPEIAIKIDGKKAKMSWEEVVSAYNGIDSVVECPMMEKVAKSCDHKWKNYTGLSEQFEYCEICDERK